MKIWLKLEELMMFVACILAFHYLGIGNVWFWIFLLAPDISAIGYLFSNKIGAFCYNFAHHKGVAILIGLIGFFTQNKILMASGIVLLAHSSLDRLLGYGLKLPSSFQDTHLGKIGKRMK